MKKIFITQLLAFAVMNINAQLVVDSLGRVGIGTDTSKSTLSIGSSGNEDAALSCYLNNNQVYGIHISKYSASSNTIYGGDITVRKGTGDGIGLRSMAYGNIAMNSPQLAIGLSGHACRAQTAIGVFGGKGMGTSSCSSYAGVFGTENGFSPSFNYGSYDFSGIYAGYFRGDV